MNNKNILISGMGLAGLVCAYWLKRYGFKPTIIERTSSLNKGGYKIDIRGSAVNVVKWMNVYDKLKANVTDILEGQIVDNDGNVIETVTGNEFGLRANEDLELYRGDICEIFYDTLSDVDLYFGESINKIHENEDYVEVVFQSGEKESFDLIIGADGLHSKVRNLHYTNIDDCYKKLGLFISIYSLPNHLGLVKKELLLQRDNKLVNLYSTNKDTNAKVALMFSSNSDTDDTRNIEKQKQIILETFKDFKWEIPRILSFLHSSDDFYYDSIAQIKLNKWHEGRVVLVGDSCYCPSPASGQGSSLAIIGAYILSGELKNANGNYGVAFTEYQNKFQKFVKDNQKLGELTAKNLSNTHDNTIDPVELTKMYEQISNSIILERYFD